MRLKHILRWFLLFLSFLFLTFSIVIKSLSPSVSLNLAICQNSELVILEGDPAWTLQDASFPALVNLGHPNSPKELDGKASVRPCKPAPGNFVFSGLQFLKLERQYVRSYAAILEFLELLGDHRPVIMGSLFNRVTLSSLQVPHLFWIARSKTAPLVFTLPQRILDPF